MPGVGDIGSIGMGRVGIGSNFAKARLMLAKRAGYLPNNFQLQPDQAVEQWKSASSNLARDARAAGFQNPLMFLRQGATQGGKTPKTTTIRPGANSDPSSALAYATSRIAQLQGTKFGMPRLPGLPKPGGLSPELIRMLMGARNG